MIFLACYRSISKHIHLVGECFILKIHQNNQMYYTYQLDQGGHTHPQRRSASHESRWRQLSTQSLSWHVKFSSCQEPEELVLAYFSDEGLW